MKILIQKIHNNNFLTIFFAVSAGVFVLIISKYLSQITIPFFKTWFNFNFYTENIFFKFYILFLSVLFILIINKGVLKNYGFKKTENFNWLKMTFVSVGIIIAAFIFGAIFFMGILTHLFPPENTTSFPEQKSIIEMILTIWIW